MDEKINIEDFAKVDMRIGKIIQVSRFRRFLLFMNLALNKT